MRKKRMDLVSPCKYILRCGNTTGHKSEICEPCGKKMCACGTAFDSRKGWTACPQCRAKKRYTMRRNDYVVENPQPMEIE